jgi:hypothetical protein
LETEAIVVEAVTETTDEAVESHKTTDEITETAEETPEETSDETFDETPDEDPDETPDDVDTVAQEPVREVYRHTCRYNSCPTRWSRFSTAGEEADGLVAEICNDPIIHRLDYSNTDGWHTVSFEIQSPDMRTFLSEALANYQDLDPEVEGWYVEPIRLGKKD